MIVLKFGGTSVGSIEAFSQVAKIVSQRMQEQADPSVDSLEYPRGVVVVTSAMSGVTNALIGAAQRAKGGDDAFYEEAQEKLRQTHWNIVEQFIEDAEEKAALTALFDKRLRQFGRLCSSIAVLGELTDRGLDVVSGLGERMSAPLLAAVFRSTGLKAEFIDAAEIVITDNVHGGAEPIMDRTKTLCRERLLPLLADGTVPVITGFVGTSIDGAPTTLGRGGSDYSAAIIGAALDAEEIQIWTDVNGVLTADPRMVPDARSLNQLTYEEVGELAYYGAKVLHPKTVTPAIAKQIPLRVLNTFNPNHAGTKIVSRPAQEVHGTVKAVTAIRQMNLITVAGRGLMGVPGMAARTFESVADVGANVLMISQSSSEQSICFVVPDESATKVVDGLQAEFSKELERRYIDRIDHVSQIVIVAVVGSGMRGVPGLAAGVFNALAGDEINVVAISQGSSEANISVVLSDDDVVQAVRSIHRAFELHKPTEDRQ